MKNRLLKKSCFFLLVILVAMSGFLLLIRQDNKYTYPGVQAADGVLPLAESELEEHPVRFLVRGWEFYQGELLSPTQIGSIDPDRILYIGQYLGFELDDPKASPYGSATYALRMLIPDAPRAYMLEIPEIYSACKIYINGSLMEQRGDPEPAQYLPRTANSALTFLAQREIEIVIHVSNFSEYYSGLIYPPAFGLPDAVSPLLSQKLLLRALLCFTALTIGVLCLFLGIRIRRNGLSALYGLLCLCFIGYAGYPLVHTLGLSGLFWYPFERIFYCLMLALISWISGAILGADKRLSGAVAAAGLLLCIMGVWVHGGIDLQWLLLFSHLLSAYKLILLFFLLAFAARAVYKGLRHSALLFSGLLVFACALLTEQLYPLFEPVLLGWPMELAGFFLVASIGAAIGAEAVNVYRERRLLTGRVAEIEQLVEMQKGHYRFLTETIKETKEARHDLRHHMRTIGDLLEENRYGELSAYAMAYGSSLQMDNALSLCEHYVADVILRRYEQLAKALSIELRVRAEIPEILSLSDADLCNLLGNCLENAFEAARALPLGTGWVSVSAWTNKNDLAVVIENNFDGNVKREGDSFLSKKRGGKKEGLGIASVRATAGRCGGIVRLVEDTKRKTFQVSLLLPEAVRRENT